MATATPKGTNAKRETFETKLSRFGKRWFIRLGILIMLAIAIFESYVQIRGVALHYGRPMLNASLIPISLDVFGVIAAFRSRESGITRIARFIARICMWSAIVISLLLNIQAGILTSNGLSGIDLVWSLFLSAIPAFGVLGTSEMFTHTHKGTTPNSAQAAQNGLMGLVVAKFAKAKEAPKKGVPAQRNRSTSTTKKPASKATAPTLDEVPQSA